jgi:hypothetical protein
LLVLLLLSSLLVPVGASAASAPSNVKVFPNPPGQVCVSWNAYEGAKQYKIYDGGGNFIEIAGTAATPKCMPSDFGTCFAVSATTNSGETDRSVAVCASAPTQTSPASEQQILTAATTSVANCIPYPGSAFIIPNQPSIFCNQATQGQVICGGGDGGGGGGRTYTDSVLSGGYGRGGGGGGGARDCELDGGPLDFQLPQIDYSTTASYDPSIEAWVLSVPELQGLDPQSVDKVLAAAGCLAGGVAAGSVIFPPAYPVAKALSLTVALVRAKNDEDIAWILVSVAGIADPNAATLSLVHSCGSAASEIFQ